MELFEKTVAKATNLPTNGEWWSKNMTATKEQCNKLLNPKHQNPNWNSGVPRNFIKD